MMRSGTRIAHFRSDVGEPYFEESTLVQQTSFFGTRLNFTISGTLNLNSRKDVPIPGSCGSNSIVNNTDQNMVFFF